MAGPKFCWANYGRDIFLDFLAVPILLDSYYGWAIFGWAIDWPSKINFSIWLCHLLTGPKMAAAGLENVFFPNTSF